MLAALTARIPHMADQLYLSYWLRNFSEPTMLRHYEKLLRLFPFSRLAKQPSTFKVIAVNYSEPIVLEVPYPPPVPIDDILAAAKEFQNADSCYRLETWWDLWRFNGDWEVEPTRVSLACFGPDFDQGAAGFHPAQQAAVTEFPRSAESTALNCALEIEFGIDANFLPQPELADSPRMVQSNIKSLLKLVHDLDDALPVETRMLWSESGENFAEKLHQALTATAE
jgi:hypothetical protein